VKQEFTQIVISTHGPGLYSFTIEAGAFIQRSGITDGLLTCFVQHTSASLVVQENADPDVLADLEDFMRRLAPRESRAYRHIAEGPDDMPSHIRSALTATSISVPVRLGKPGLGTWQGLYLFEHRDDPHRRDILLHLFGA
jgi:secondary thiamine-phosphate synthase enzyme